MSDNTNIFFSPPNTGGVDNEDYLNPVYTIGSSLNVTYSVNASNYQIELWQQWSDGEGANQGPTIFSATENDQPNTTVQNFVWPCQIYDLNLTYSPVFYLWTFDYASPQHPYSIFRSHFFNLTESSLTTSSSSTSSTSSPTASATPSQTTAGTTTHAASNGLSTGAKAGIGIGVAIGALALLGLVILLLFRRRRNIRRDKHTSTKLEKDMPGYAGGYGSEQHTQQEMELLREKTRAKAELEAQELEAQQRAQELEGSHRTQELDAGQRAIELP